MDLGDGYILHIGKVLKKGVQQIKGKSKKANGKRTRPGSSSLHFFHVNFACNFGFLWKAFWTNHGTMVRAYKEIHPVFRL